MNSKRVLNILLLVGIVAVAALFFAVFLTGEAEADYDVGLTTEDNFGEGLPESTIYYILSVENQGTDKDRYNITFSPDPAAWDVTLSTQQTPDLKEEEEYDFKVTVKVPVWVNATDSIDITIDNRAHTRGCHFLGHIGTKLGPYQSTCDQKKQNHDFKRLFFHTNLPLKPDLKCVL